MNTANNRILIVDDNPTIREDYRRILCPSNDDADILDDLEAAVFDATCQYEKLRPNFQTAFATQGDAAAQLAQSAMDQGMPFAVAIVDIRMPPGIDGVETVKRLWRVQTDLQIILCTAYADYSWQGIIRELGVSHRLVVLKKPFDPIEVLQLCMAMTTKWAAEREMACRQLALQNRLVASVQQVERVAGELHQERRHHQNDGQAKSEAEMVDMMSGLVTGIAHDFNNALTVIQGHLSAALMTTEFTGTLEMPLEQMLQAAQRASMLSRQMMALTSDVEIPTESRLINLVELLEQQLEMIQRVMRERIQVEICHAGQDVFIRASDTLILRLMNLLIVRSRELMPKGGKLTVTVGNRDITSAEEAAGLHSAAQRGRYSVLQFDDTCLHGSASDDHSHPLWQEAAADHEPPRILSARRLVDHLGGWMSVELIEGVGCRHTIFIPSATKETNEQNRSSRPPAGLTVLVVDDEKSVCDILGYVLSSQGHRVLKAHHAMEAWTQWQTHDQNIDLVIADIYLPDGVTGFELVRHMKAQRPSLPVIYMSGYQPDTFSEGENLTIGINYLSKPFDVLDLLSTTARALESSMPPTAGQAFRPVTSEPHPAQQP
jgi:CheY-like chemotaxis protein